MTKKLSKALLAGLSLLLLLPIFPLPAVAKTRADIAGIEVNHQGDSLEVSFQILNCFTPKMEEAIRSGVSTTFHIRLALEKPGVPLIKPQVTALVLEHTIKFDHLKGEYNVHLPEHEERVRVTRDFDEAKQWMSRVEALPVIPVWRLQKGEAYQLRIKAELSKIRLPFFFRYILFFVSLWDFETDWHKVSFTT